MKKSIKRNADVDKSIKFCGMVFDGTPRQFEGKITMVKQIIRTVSVVLFLSGQSAQSGVQNLYADSVFLNGDVITLNKLSDTAEAVATKDGLISAVGRSADLRKLIGAKTQVIDLQAQTLVPGFIDAHSHFTHALIMATWANVSPPPVGKAGSIDALISILKDHWPTTNPQPKDRWLLAYGYDENTYGRHLTHRDLDAHFPNIPVMLMHISGHGAVLNSAAMKAVNIDAQTPTPKGGVIARHPGSQEPTGLLMETAWIPLLQKFLGMSLENYDASFSMAVNRYLRNGFTTIQDGSAQYADIKRYQQQAAANKLPIDLMALPIFLDQEKVFADPSFIPGRVKNRLKVAGIKLIADGSPQGKTAYFTRAFHVPSPAGEDNWHGEPLLPYEKLASLFSAASKRGWQVYTHANGDAAIDMVIKAHREAGISARDNRRNVVIHSQFVRADQLDSYIELGMIPSFFSNHAYFWGDAHTKNLGSERANFLSPMKTSIKKGLRFTNHSDYIITPLDPMMQLWTATSRESREGKIIGAEEKITPLQALRAITIDAAYQYFEEHRKGSIEVGKLADFTILSDNPLKVPLDKIREIDVVATIKEGLEVYHAP